jgi:hypothetical protein
MGIAVFAIPLAFWAMEIRTLRYQQSLVNITANPSLVQTHTLNLRATNISFSLITFIIIFMYFRLLMLRRSSRGQQ